MKKAFPTLAVVGAWSGFVMEDRGFSRIHEVFDHLYPGITTIGLAAMAENGQRYLKETVPVLSDLPEVTGENYEEVARLAIEKIGPSIEIDGPIHGRAQE